MAADGAAGLLTSISSSPAGVFKLSHSLAVVEAIDLIAPVLDDPYSYGQIAAAQAMAGIWAVGGKAIFALNLGTFPKQLPVRIQKAILAGGADKAREAGIGVLGGHVVYGAEPRYGLAVTGVVHPKKALRSSGGKGGDRLILTKPIGTGIAAAAIKRGVGGKALGRQATQQMAQLNKIAGEVLGSGKFKVNALAAVCGFGLLGHLLQLARGAGLRARLQLEQVSILEGIPQLAQAEVVPDGARLNLASAGKWVRFPKGLSEYVKLVLADAQINGGLLAAVPAKDEHKAVAALLNAGVFAAVIGSLVRGKPGIDVV